MTFTDTLGIEWPIVAFTHSPATVAAVTREGGLGVLGAANMSSESLEEALTWLDERVGDRPYGVDVLLPTRTVDNDEDAARRAIPETNREFVANLMRRFDVPEPSPEAANAHSDGQIVTEARGRAQVEVALRHRTRLLASALGPAPADITDRCHAQGLLVAGMAGQVRHAEKHVEAGADVVVAVGTEGGGHTGDIATIVLTPQVVDAVAPVPVLAAGGIASGRQMAAALALGAQGVWCGSVWLACETSEVAEPIKEKILRATSHGTVRSRWGTGRPVRQLRTPWTDAWDEPTAPEPLPAPLQGLLVRDATTSIQVHRLAEIMGYPSGQAIGMLNEETRAEEVFRAMVAEMRDTVRAVGQWDRERAGGR
jgi:NAD(P)H-dependent flavin oxidoreductase YrpB (nitropropane dioxygenase family)